MGDWKLPVKDCLSPWGTSKGNGIEPIRLTVSSMSCDLSMVIAYYDDKWTHLSNWSLSTHFSSFLESWGHYLSASDRQQWTAMGAESMHDQTQMIVLLRWIYLQRFPEKGALLCFMCWYLKYLPYTASFMRKNFLPACNILRWLDLGNFSGFICLLFIMFEYLNLCCSPGWGKLQYTNISLFWRYM